MNPTPICSIALATCSASSVNLTPAASSTSALPLVLVAPRLPCLATLAPALAATIAAAVDTLNLLEPLPPVPTKKLNCEYISSDIIENYPETTGEYNVERYIDAFNKRIKPLLVCFNPEVRDNILITTPADRQYFTHQQLELTSGQPFTETDQDTLENLLTITEEEILFWETIGISPNYMFEEYDIVDEFSLDDKQTEGSIT